jgi:hypothetical protein
MHDKTGIIKFPIVLLLVFWAGLSNTAVGSRLSSKENTAKGFYVGVCTHFSQDKGVVEMNIESMKNVGIGAIRDEATWSSLEREKGRLVMPERYTHYVRRASAAGLDVMLILDYANRFYDDGDRPRSAEAVDGFCR